jgi:release factor glutamine methyltransferase
LARLDVTDGQSVRQALALGTRQLAGSRSAVREENPRLDAEVLLRHILSLGRAALYAAPERPMEPGQLQAYVELLDRRAAGEPIAYLTGVREFMGRPFTVDERTLVPRPDTETLVERAIEILRAERPLSWGRRPLVADVGTGSGAIAVSVAASVADAAVVATDVSHGALRVARANAHRLLANPRRVRLVRCHLLAAVRAPIVLVAANLPYIPSAALAGLPRTVREYEPLGALDGGPDGLEWYRGLLRDLPRLLSPGARLLLECDPGQVSVLLELVHVLLPCRSAWAHRDATGAERVVEVVT